MPGMRSIAAGISPAKIAMVVAVTIAPSAGTGGMKKVTGTEHIAWDQLTWRQPGSNDLRWEIVPMLLKDRFSGSGTTRVIVTAQGCERIIAGDITIRVPLLGSTMEKRIVDDVRESYEKAAAVVREVLKG